MNIAAEVAAHRNEIYALAKKHGAENLRIFGSVARGEDSVASDLDILITLGPKRSPFFPGGLKADLEDLLYCDVDIVTENALHPLIRDEILSEAKPL